MTLGAERSSVARAYVANSFRLGRGRCRLNLRLALPAISFVAGREADAAGQAPAIDDSAARRAAGTRAAD